MTTSPVHRVVVDRDRYYDSVTLMRLSSQIEQLDGVIDGAVFLGTETNLEALYDLGFPRDELNGTGPTDLIIAVTARGLNHSLNALLRR